MTVPWLWCSKEALGLARQREMVGGRQVLTGRVGGGVVGGGGGQQGRGGEGQG